MTLETIKKISTLCNINDYRYHLQGVEYKSPEEGLEVDFKVFRN